MKIITSTLKIGNFRRPGDDLKPYQADQTELNPGALSRIRLALVTQHQGGTKILLHSSMSVS